ncbi:hypothetical protein [Mesorhizobium amorphae]|uniref:hypothetical protein n=1 Tax=Mesorhizobium amorphae TaxID=71433 RepID=UPI0017829A75|nr:hypothetical protein [Mesorhizobium amorphae]
MILQTIAMAFHRPAFEVPLHCETTDEFLQTLQDTQRALRTGELLDRQSRHAIRKSIGGWRELSDRSWRVRMGRIDKQLRELRTKLAQGLKDGTIRRTHSFLDFLNRRQAEDLEELRGKCVRDLNRLLREAGIHPV